jgi:hypothetical protein
MKKKNKKQTVPAYAFGMDQLSNYLGGANVIGSAISGLSTEGSTGDVVGSTLGSTASLAGAGTAFGPIGTAVGGGLGLVTGLIGSIKRKKQMQEMKRRKETLNKSQLGMNNAAVAESEYWDDNTLAYTFENGGILPDLAYLDNNEIVRDDYGNISQVPNTQPGTDNHLIDASNLESVLSDKIKRPGTKRTFAKEGQILSKMTKPSKGKDIFAENTNKLNKINANRAYNRLLAEQEAVKAVKGVKPKVKGIPAYEDGTNGWKKWFMPSALARKTGREAAGELVQALPVQQWDPRWTSALKIAGETGKATPSNAPSAWTEGFESMAGPAPGRAYRYNSPNNQTDAITYTNDEPISIDIPTPPATPSPTVTSAYINVSNKPVIKTSSPKTNTTPQKDEFVYSNGKMIKKSDANNLLPTKKPRVNTSMKIDWDDVIKGIDPKKANKIYEDYKNQVNEESGNYSPDWLSLAPTVYNALQSLRGPEEEPLALNPYAGAVRSTMARRKMNIEPARLANSRSRAISNYNLANINANTGANLAARTQAAVDEYAANANMYATKQNADNAYLGEYANTLNNLGQQFVQSRTLANDLNAKNRAAARSFGTAAVSQLGQWSQVNRQMKNQAARDNMVYPYLANFLAYGNPTELIQQMNRQYYKK